MTSLVTFPACTSAAWCLMVKELQSNPPCTGTFFGIYGIEEIHISSALTLEVNILVDYLLKLFTQGKSYSARSNESRSRVGEFHVSVLKS